MVREPGRTPGQAEGPDDPKRKQLKGQKVKHEPGRTPDQAEGADPEQEKQVRRKLSETMREDKR